MTNAVLPDGAWKLQLSGDIDPTYSSVMFATVDQLLEYVGESLECMAGFPCEGDAMTFTITIVKMTDAELEGLDPC